MNTTKKCYKCKNRKELDEFYKDKYQTDGRTTSCKDCSKTRRKQWSAENREQTRQYNKTYYQKHREKLLTNQGMNQRAGHANRKAVRLGAPGIISADDIRRVFSACGFRCLRCGTENSLSLDHVVSFANGGANTIQNLQVLCCSCNASKKADTTDYRTPEILEDLQNRLIN